MRDKYLRGSCYNKNIHLSGLYLLLMDDCFCNDHFHIIQRAAKVYKDEEELETYIHSDLYGVYDKVRQVMISLFPFLLSPFRACKSGNNIKQDYFFFDRNIKQDY